MSTLETNLIQPATGTALQVGASGDTITVPSGATFNVAGTAGTNIGKILQVVTATDATTRSTSSTTYVTASNTLTADITPASTSNKVYVNVSGSCYCNTSSKRFYASIFRDASNLGPADGMIQGFSSAGGILSSVGMSFLDSPSSTSALTYQVYIKAESPATVYLNEYLVKGSITLFEVAG
jgi:hypothetical protein